MKILHQKKKKIIVKF